jgi:hypothetical protein
MRILTSSLLENTMIKCSTMRGYRACVCLDASRKETKDFVDHLSNSLKNDIVQINRKNECVFPIQFKDPSGKFGGTITLVSIHDLGYLLGRKFDEIFVHCADKEKVGQEVFDIFLSDNLCGRRIREVSYEGDKWGKSVIYEAIPFEEVHSDSDALDDFLSTFKIINM